MMKKFILGAMLSTFIISAFCGCSKKVDVTESQIVTTESETDEDPAAETTETLADDTTSDTVTTESTTNENGEWKEAYCNYTGFLDDEFGCEYVIVDPNNDGIPEVFRTNIDYFSIYSLDKFNTVSELGFGEVISVGNGSIYTEKGMLPQVDTTTITMYRFSEETGSWYADNQLVITLDSSYYNSSMSLSWDELKKSDEYCSYKVGDKEFDNYEEAAKAFSEDYASGKYEKIVRESGSFEFYDYETFIKKIKSYGSGDVAVADEWREAYIDYLESHKGELFDSAFISYVCEGDVPFLFVAKGGEWKDGMLIYTYDNGELKQVGDGEYGHYGSVNTFAGMGMICVSGIMQGHQWDTFYYVTPSGEVTEGDSFDIEGIDADDQIYHYNDEILDYETWMQKKMDITKGKSGMCDVVLPIDKLIEYINGDLQKRTVKYGDTITTNCDIRVVGALSNKYGVEYLSEGGEYGTFVVSSDSSQFIDDEFEQPSEEEIMKNVNEAIGKRVGDTFTIRFSGGDGTYYHVHTIISIE